jgi:hypothetical protein
MDLKEGVGVEWETGRLVTFVRNNIWPTCNICQKYYSPSQT